MTRVRFTRYNNSDSLGNTYVFGFNIYRDYRRLFTVDLIIGKRVFVFYLERTDS